MSISRQIFDVALAAVLKAHNVDPAGTGPVPIEKMASIARQVRGEINRIGVTDSELLDCFNWLLAEVLDRSMTQAGLNMAILELSKGFGVQPIRPS